MFEHTSRKPGGTFIMTDASGNVVERDTKMCCHCGRHWIVKPGSGAVRSFCPRCNDHCCGSKECMECIPFEKKLDLYEKGEIRWL